WQPILSAAGYQERIPVTLQGRASFNGTATGKLSDIAFAGTLQSQTFDVLIRSSEEAEKRVHWDSLVADIQLSPHLFAAHTAGLHLQGGEAQFTSIQLVQQDARVTGDATYNLSTHAFHLNATGDNFDLARIAVLQTSRVAVEGRMNFTATGSGTLEEPVINA